MADLLVWSTAGGVVGVIRMYEVAVAAKVFNLDPGLFFLGMWTGAVFPGVGLKARGVKGAKELRFEFACETVTVLNDLSEIDGGNYVKKVLQRTR